jgi:hypothetical protein
MLPSQFSPRSFAILVLLSLCVGCTPLVIGVVGGAAAGGVESVRADQKRQHSTTTYIATVASNALYVPAKVIFAGVGALTSGLAYIVTFGDRKVSEDIWDSSVYGDYVLTPSMIEGHEPVQFVH